MRIDPSAYAVPGDAEPPAEAIEAAKLAIRAEPKVKDLLYQPGQAFEWQVGVLNDGTNRSGYASYICQLIAENGALTLNTMSEWSTSRWSAAARIFGPRRSGKHLAPTEPSAIFRSKPAGQFLHVETRCGYHIATATKATNWSGGSLSA